MCPRFLQALAVPFPVPELLLQLAARVDAHVLVLAVLGEKPRLTPFSHDGSNSHGP